MRFRPCIDIHNGKVKQIVGSSLSDQGDQAKENFVSDLDAADFARRYQADGLSGGHVILLNPVSSPMYPVTLQQALSALSAAPGTLQAGGGVIPENAEVFLNAGASHVIVTSYVFRDGRIDYDRLEKLKQAVGRERLVLDLSCRGAEGVYYIMTDRWQKQTDEILSPAFLEELSVWCDEFLIHAVDAEGKSKGPQREVLRILADYEEGREGNKGPLPVTYAGGIRDLDDLRLIREEGRGRIDVTIGSALDLFGGPLRYRDVVSQMRHGDGSY